MTVCNFTTEVPPLSKQLAEFEQMTNSLLLCSKMWDDCPTTHAVDCMVDWEVSTQQGVFDCNGKIPLRQIDPSEFGLMSTTKKIAH